MYVNWWLLQYRHIIIYVYLPFVFVSRMCPTPNPAKTSNFKAQEAIEKKWSCAKTALEAQRKQKKVTKAAPS